MVGECGVAALYLTSVLGFAVNSSPQQESIPTFGTTVVIPSGLRGQIYFINPGMWWLPDFSRLKPVGTIYTTPLDVPAPEHADEHGRHHRFGRVHGGGDGPGRKIAVSVSALRGPRGRSYPGPADRHFPISRIIRNPRVPGG